MIPLKIFGSVKSLLDISFDELAEQNKQAVRGAGTFLLDLLRAQVRAAGLGKRLEKAWRVRFYPERVETIHPMAFIYSNAVKIHDAYNKGGIIKTKNGARYLAIPTKNVPRNFSSKLPMAPVQAEAQFNCDLEFIAHKDGRPGGVLVMPKLIASLNGKGWRKNTKRRVKKGRDVENVVMFYLVPSVQLKKKLDIEGAIKAAESNFYNRLLRE